MTPRNVSLTRSSKRTIASDGVPADNQSAVDLRVVPGQPPRVERVHCLLQTALQTTAVAKQMSAT